MNGITANSPQGMMPRPVCASTQRVVTAAASVGYGTTRKRNINKVLLDNMPSLTSPMNSPKNQSAFPVPAQLLQSSRDEELASHYGDHKESNPMMESVEVDLKLKPKGFPSTSSGGDGPTNSQQMNSA